MTLYVDQSQMTEMPKNYLGYSKCLVECSYKVSSPCKVPVAVHTMSENTPDLMGSVQPVLDTPFGYLPFIWKISIKDNKTF